MQSAKRNGSFRIAWCASVVALALSVPGALTNASAAESQPYRKGVVQDLSYGQVAGAVVHDGTTLLWKGIPYGKAPEGALRWKAPVSPDPWAGTFDATRDPGVGIQVAAGKVLGSENCLNLDIYRPNTEETGLPVLVYIHGGNNQSGTSQEINAQQLAPAAHAVVVSINYRLGLLGFNDLPALRTGDPREDSGNYTLLDISKSLDWIKENIASFGGNPGNVTVSGFSAGGRDVMAMLISPIFTGQFQKAISFSGGMTVADSAASAELIAKAIAPLAVQDKVKATESEAAQWLLSSDPAVKDYLYHLSADRLARLMPDAGIRMAAFPHLFNDGTVLPKDGFRTTRYNAVPLIMATGSNEFSLFARFDAAYSALKDDALLAGGREAKDYQAAVHYGSELYALFNAQESAEKMFDRYGAPIYTVRFAWGGNPQAVGERMGRLFGSFHGIWIPLLTGETTGFSANFPGSFKDPGARELGGKFQQYIANFLWRGTPNGNGLVAWKSWESAKSGPTQLVLDADLKHAKVSMSHERQDYGKILRDLDADKSIPQADKEKIVKEVLDGRWFSRMLDKHYGNQNLWIGID